MNFPKNSSNPMLRINPVELARVCANPTWVYLCESDKIFVPSMRGCVIVWIWGEDERARETWGNCERSSMGGVQRLICCVFGGRVEKIWVNLRLEEIK